MRLGCAILAVVILAALSIQASAQGNVIFGQGKNSCGAWTQARQTRSVSAGLSAQWVAGYLSGMNTQLNLSSPQNDSLYRQDDPLLGTDFDGLMGWIDNYCMSHPLKPIVAAAQSLIDELRARAQRRQ
jgi:hypothetical protein